MTKNQPDIFVYKKQFKLKTKKMTKLVCDLKSLNSHCLSLWQCLVIYLLKFKIIFLNKTMDILNKFTISSLVCIIKVISKDSICVCYVSKKRIKFILITQLTFFEQWKCIPKKNFCYLCHKYCFKFVCTSLDFTWRNNNVSKLCTK